MSASLKPYLTLHLLVLIWGFTAILGMLITLPPVEVVFYRTLFASLGLVVFVLSTKRSFKSTGILKQLGTGAIIAAHWILFFLAARVSNVSVCLAGLATISLWTALLEPLYYKKNVKPFEIVLALIAVVGMVIIFQVELKFWLGLVLGILSAFLASIFTIINADFVRRNRDPFVITFYEMVGAWLSIVVFLPFYGSFQADGITLAMNMSDLWWLLILALVCTVYAYSVSVQLMHHISPFVMNLTVNLEPVYGIILALIIFGNREEMSGGFYLGTMLILLAVLAYPVYNRRFKRKPLDNRHAAP